MFNKHVIKELSSYLDNQLSDKEKAKIDAHLSRCQLCAQELSRLKTLSDKLKLWHAPVLDAGFDSSVTNEIVRRELERGAVKMKKKTWAVLIPSSALAGILVFVFVFGAMQNYLKIGVKARLNESKEVDRKELVYSYDPYYRMEGKGDYARGRGFTESRINEQNLLCKISPTERVFTGQQPIQQALKTEIPQNYDNLTGSGPVIVIQPSLPATGEGEWIIRTATIKLEVENGRETYNKISGLCKELGGYLGNSNFYEDRNGRQSGSITLRIPKDKFLASIDKLSALGKVEDINTDSQDVSRQYAALKSQLDATMVVYNKMLEALQKRQVTIPEAVRLESELTPVLKRVEELKNAIENLNNSVSFTTISVYFHETVITNKALTESLKLIKQSMLQAAVNTVKFLAAVIPVALIGVILFGLAILAVVILKYWIIRIFKRG